MNLNLKSMELNLIRFIKLTKQKYIEDRYDEAAGLLLILKLNINLN